MKKILDKFEAMLKTTEYVFFGIKPLISCVPVIVTQFNRDSDAVAIKARGRAIGRVVDTAEIERSWFVKDAEVITKSYDTDDH